MKRVVAIALLCVGALSLIISIVKDRSQSSPQPLAELHPCDGIMCFLDIEPRKILLTDAQTILKNSLDLAPSDYGTNTAFKRSYPYYRIDLVGPSENCNNQTPKCVDGIELVFPLGYESVSAGQIVSAFGLPCAILPFYLPQHEVLIYPGMVLFFMSDSQSDTVRFLPTQLLTQVNIFDNGKSCEELLAKQDSYYLWRGFTIYQKKQ